MADEVALTSLRDEESLRFFHVLCHRDSAARRLGIDSIRKTFDAWLDGYGSPKQIHGETGINGFQPVVTEYLPELLCLSIQCPFDDVREALADILEDVKKRGRGLQVPRRLENGASHFISEKEIVPVDTPDDKTRTLFVDAFLQNNRLEHITQLMGYHPDYLECFLRTQHYLLKEDGPLPFEYRHYIAIMAAGRHQCSYLIKLQSHEFLLQGGDPDWLKGLERIPRKLKDLNEINKILAHRPWLITKDHIEKLTRGKDSWSVSEVVHALVIMAQFHALSSFVFGCGINQEVDQDGGYTFRPPSVSDASEVDYSSDGSSGGENCSEFEGGGLSVLMEKMRALTEAREEEMTQDELLKRFQHVESQNALITTNAQPPSPKSDILCYVDDTTFQYEDFAKRGSASEIPTFRAQDYSWEDQGFSLANRLYTDVGNLLDEKFNVAYNLTYYTMGDNTSVDTTAFRRTIWNYIHCMYGIRHDDYNYGEVNQLLERNLKAYIKTVTCYPERLKKKDYDGVMREFKHSEKVHVNLMLFEARLQAELLYSLRAVMRHMT
ncbi:sestrin-1-like isoform X1 [Haliotis asinina]|uniref:sestrin-1-like isoform X1 n=1 Tax=Haliotis asinina TaxID=109174 RepID=UPI003532293D